MENVKREGCWRLKYNEHDNIVHKKYPDGGIWKYVYDVNSNRTCEESHNGDEYHGNMVYQKDSRGIESFWKY